MNEPNKEYIDYLNSLNSYNAKNKNAYSEKNIDNKYFNDILVRVGVCDFIIDKLENEPAQLLVLTGQAGDGKTSIMYQVLSDFGVQIRNDINDFSITLKNGKTCRCIKDFSELSDDLKISILKDIVTYPEQNKYAFIVANTGPFINTYGKLFENLEQSEIEKIKLVKEINNSTGDISTILKHKISVINIATIDNTYFASEFLDKITQDSLWSNCSLCSKCNTCHILRNKRLIKENKTRVFEFINNHYSWLVANGTRLTIRSITEQLSFMLTGGCSCENVRADDSYQYLFSNLFFGFKGTQEDNKAKRIIGIKAADSCKYDTKKLTVDDKLLVKNDYNNVFSAEIAKFISTQEGLYQNFEPAWCSFIRRTYFFLSQNITNEQKEIDLSDIFSPNFSIYMQLRNTKVQTNMILKNNIINALSMIYTGVPVDRNASSIPLTLSRRSGVTQTVQLINGQCYLDRIEIRKRLTKDGKINKREPVYEIILRVNDIDISTPLTLPMLDYFDDLKNGIIETVVDPQLSHGVESLKAQLSSIIEKKNSDNTFDLYVLKNKAPQKLKFELDKDKLIVQ